MGPEYNFSILFKQLPVLYILIALLIVPSFMLGTLFVQLKLFLAFNMESIKFVTKRVCVILPLCFAGGIFAL